MRRRVAAALVALLVAATTIPIASPTDHRPRVPIGYDVELLDADEGLYRIETTFRNLDGNVHKLELQGASYVLNYPDCRNLVVDGDAKDSCDGQFEVEIDGNRLTYSYEAVLDIAATEDGYNAVTTPDWAVLQANGIGFQFSYSFTEGRKPIFDPTLGFGLPDGWDAEASFPRTDGGDRFQLEARFPRPVGIVVLGSFETTDVTVVGRDGVVAEIAPSDEEIGALVKSTGSYLRSTHGDRLGPKPLFVSAPDPFKNGGIASRDGFVVHSERADEQTVVHEWVHLWQRFEVCNRPQGRDCFPPAGSEPDDTSGSTVWVKEGGAEVYSGLALFAAGEWSAPRVQRFFDRIEDRYDEGELDDTVYGASQDPAYTKGALVVARMDERIRDDSNRTQDLGTVLSAMNADAASETGSLIVTNDMFQAKIESITDEDWSGFFDDYVDGTEDPGPHEFNPTGTFQLSQLVVTPDPVVAGGSMTISANVTNTGTAHDNQTIRFFVDGSVVGNATVDLEAGASTTIDATTNVSEPGTVRVEVGTLSADVEVRAPPDLVPVSVRPEASRPRAEEPYTVLVDLTNRGDLTDRARVRLDLEGQPVGNRSATVPGGSAATVRFQQVVSPAGTVNATVTLTWSGPTRIQEGSWTVAERGTFQVPSTPAGGVVVMLAVIALAARVWSKR